MKNILLCSILIISTGLAYAGDFSDYYKNCVVRKNGKFDYEIKPFDPHGDMYETVSGYDNAAHNTISNIIRGSTRIYDEGRNVVSVYRNSRHIEGKYIRDSTIRSLRQQVSRYHLDDFEKAGLVNCAVGSLINYMPNMSTKLGSLLKIYEEGQGICTEMTDVARDLAKAVGLKTRTVSSTGAHTWPEYRIGGKWYILDPGAYGTMFMESPKQ
jgi:hypothetical protein